jgi:uncharacterized membrane protein
LQIARTHLNHHGRFYAALGIGVCVFAVDRMLSGPVPVAAAADAFFAFYLLTCAPLLIHSTTEDLKRRAAEEDEGAVFVVVLALAIIGFNLTDVFLALNRTPPMDSRSLMLIAAGAPLGWFVLHTIYAFRYADLHYADPPGDAEPGRALEFPGEEAPGLWDFLYFSFVIGMTAQVSDVQIRTTTMRRAVTGHSIVSFFFNTVLIAMVVNAVLAGH